MKKSVKFQNKEKGFGRDKVSTLFLTLNTNSRNLVKEKQLQKVAQEYFDNIEEFLRYLHRDEERNNPNYIDDVRIQSCVERGKKEQRVHLHSLIRIEHRTKVQIDLRETTNFFKSKLRLKNVYLHVDFVEDNDISLLKYMRK